MAVCQLEPLEQALRAAFKHTWERSGEGKRVLFMILEERIFTQDVLGTLEF